MLDLSKNFIELTHSLGVKDSIADMDGEAKVNCYEDLLAKAIIMRANAKDPSISYANQDKVFPYIKHILEWLRTTDFYTAPASTKYHDACHAGLLTHTLEAYIQLNGLRSVPKFKQVVDNQWWSAVFAVLVHDWCKIGRYESYVKWVKDEHMPDMNVWNQTSAYRYKEDGTGRLGHGPQSLVVAMQLCNNSLLALSFEEMAAIRWHMDNWDVTSYDAVDLYTCNTKIPMVRMVQFADQLATTEY